MRAQELVMFGPTKFICPIIIERTVFVTCYLLMAGSEAIGFNYPHSLHLSNRFLKDLTVSASTTYEGSLFHSVTTLLLKSEVLAGVQTRSLFPELVSDGLSGVA